MTSQMGCSAFLFFFFFFFLLALDLVCVCACCDFQYGHHLEIGLHHVAEGLRPLCGAIFIFWVALVFNQTYSNFAGLFRCQSASWAWAPGTRWTSNWERAIGLEKLFIGARTAQWGRTSENDRLGQARAWKEAQRPVRATGCKFYFILFYFFFCGMICSSVSLVECQTKVLLVWHLVNTKIMCSEALIVPAQEEFW